MDLFFNSKRMKESFDYAELKSTRLDEAPSLTAIFLPDFSSDIMILDTIYFPEKQCNKKSINLFLFSFLIPQR